MPEPWRGAKKRSSNTKNQKKPARDNGSFLIKSIQTREQNDLHDVHRDRPRPRLRGRASEGELRFSKTSWPATGRDRRLHTTTRRGVPLDAREPPGETANDIVERVASNASNERTNDRRGWVTKERRRWTNTSTRRTRSRSRTPRRTRTTAGTREAITEAMTITTTIRYDAMDARARRIDGRGGSSVVSKGSAIG